MQSYGFFVLLLKMAVIVAVNAESPEYETDEDECLLQLADHCFRDVSDSLACNLNPDLLPDCQNRGITYLCNSAEDALKCSEDIVDSGCTMQQERDNFDMWMKGLHSVFDYMCIKSRQYLAYLLDNPNCWNHSKFIQCVERETGIRHVVDFMRIKLSVAVCLQTLNSLAFCNVNATAPLCEDNQSVISEVMKAFLDGTNCGCASKTTSSAYRFPILPYLRSFNMLLLLYYSGKFQGHI